MDLWTSGGPIYEKKKHHSAASGIIIAYNPFKQTQLTCACRDKVVRDLSEVIVIVTNSMPNRVSSTSAVTT